MKKYSLLFSLLAMVSCQDRKENKGTQQRQHPQLLAVRPNPFVIQNLPAVPEEIEGCTCLFSKDSSDFTADKYVFAANNDSVAYMNLSGHVEKLKLVSTTKTPDSFSDHGHADVYRNKDYKVKLDVKYKQSGTGETWRNTGTMMVEDKAGKVTVKPFYGECGC